MRSSTRTLLSGIITCLSLPRLSLSQPSIYYNGTPTDCANTSNMSVEYAQCLNYTPAWESCPDPTLCEPATGDNVGLAFGLTIGAGLATTLGALLPFIPFIKRSNITFLAVGLALAAGVMLYVSFTEILTKSRDNFCCRTPDHYDVAATGCFFGGIILTILLDFLVSLLQRLDCGCTSSCGSRCSRRESKDLDNKDAITSSKVKVSLKAFHHVRSGTHKMNGLHKEFDFVSESGHTPMVSSPSDVSTTSMPTADSLEKGVEPGKTVTIETNNNNAKTESAFNSKPPSNSSRAALLANDVDSTSSAMDSTAAVTSHSSISDTESRRHAAITPDGASTTLSENTNNYGNASVNELFSNSSLLRMNAVILPETANGTVTSGVGAENGVGVIIVDSKSHVSVTIEENGDGGDSVMMVDGDGEKKAGARMLVRRESYSEMVDQKHDDIVEPMGPSEFKEVAMVLGKDAKRLHRMGILTGLAVGIHNFPEGLATFVAALSSPSLGIALAIAIALHNIPEGVCVSMPVYYATGKKWKGFLWAFLSGISEPFGALLGWLVFKDLFGPLVYGCLFGVIAGMMVFISLKELLPTAHKFDKGGNLVAIFIVLGMAIMAASLLLFLY